MHIRISSRAPPFLSETGKYKQIQKGKYK